MLNKEDLDFLNEHIRKKTRGTYGSMWYWFQKYFKIYNVISLLAL